MTYINTKHINKTIMYKYINDLKTEKKLEEKYFLECRKFGTTLLIPKKNPWNMTSHQRSNKP